MPLIPVTTIRNFTSLTARFYIDDLNKDKGIKVLSFDFSFSQDVDNRGMVNSDIRAGLVHISIPGIDDTGIIQWMLGRDTRKDCHISFSAIVDSGPRRTIDFLDAVLVNYHESYSDPSDIVINLTISSRKIKIRDAEYENHWTPSGE